MSTIPFIFEDIAGPTSGTLGVLTPRILIKNIDAAKIRKSLSEISAQISEILQDIKNVGEFKLKEVQLSVEINAEGGVALIGNAKAGTKGAISLTFSI